MKIYLLIWIILISLFSPLTKAESGVNELSIPLHRSLISLDPGGVQDASSLFISRQVNCQLVRSQGSNFILDAAESIKYITPLKIILIQNKLYCLL